MYLILARRSRGKGGTQLLVLVLEATSDSGHLATQNTTYVHLQIQHYKDMTTEGKA